MKTQTRVQKMSLVVVIIGVAAFACKGKDEAQPAESAKGATALSKAEFLTAVEESVSDGSLLKNGTVTIENYEPDAVRLRYVLNSPRPRMTRPKAEVITKGLVKFAIDVLMANGRDPREELIFVSAYAFQPSGKSATGRDQLFTHGNAWYDFNDDAIKFKAHK